MKRFIWLVLLAAAGYGVWKYYPEIERMARERTAGDVSAPAPTDPAESLPAPSTTRVQPSVATARSAPAPGPDDDIAARYPLPEFRTIEALTGDWKKIPASAFPREVTLTSAVEMQLAGGAGTSRFDAGSKVMAVSGAEGVLTVTPSLGASVRGTAAIDQTDFKSVLGAVYEEFKRRKRAEVARLREQAREEAKAAKTAGPALATVLTSHGTPPPADVQAKIGPRPEQNPDRTVPVMLASIAERTAKKKESEPKLPDISGWGPVTFRTVNGEPYWGGSVRYTARTIFGEFPTEAVALMRHGRVVKWIYSGTGEPVP
jgi:hypothetical protein